MAYLTTQEYIRRYGAQETATITNEVRATPGTAPAIVESKVEEAIEDATDFVDGYIGTRYSLPLSTTPRLVIGWTAVLARELLYRSRPLPAVTDAADRVREQLKDLANRKIDLPIAPGDEPPVQGGNNGAAQSSGDAPCPTFSGSSMDRYMGGFGHGSRVPCWRNGGR